jgi:hypothetical protein
VRAVGALEITAGLQPRGPAAAFVLSEEQVATVGEGAKRFAARLTTATAEVRGNVTRMRGEFLFGLSRALREQAGLEIGDTVTFTLALDDAPREVEVPGDLARALRDDAAAQAAFDGLAFTHRKEFARWVAEAKRDETRERRVLQTLEMLHEGRTRS